jgi:outer membrane receptor protein involved in Fe transport
MKQNLVFSTCAAAGISFGLARAFADLNPTNTAPEQLPAVIVTGRADSQVGIADTASVGTVGAEQLARRPILRPGELLETVPGIIISQHSGAGKANQYYLRGFNLDHGSDFATTLDGMPINLPTHAHGQGYTDLNMMIPELVGTVHYHKGPYFADEGDFSSAGAAHMSYVNTLPQSLMKIEGGSFNYWRGLFASSPKLGEGHLLYAGELYHNDGPWEHPDDFWKGNGVVRYSQGDVALGFSVTAMAYKGKWDATDQIPRRAVEDGSLDRFDGIDDTTGGDSQRYSLQAEWHRDNDATATHISAYGFYYDLDLFSNFTYFLDDPVNGDQFEQADRRWVAGMKADHTWRGELSGRPAETTIGLQSRNDIIRNGLYHTVARERLSTTRQDDVVQNSIGLFAENKTQWADKFRTTAGLRSDIYHFDVSSDNAANSGDNWSALASPKGSLIFGPWADTEFYLSGGLGFHSNDGRGTTTRADPGSGDPVTPVDALVRTCGAEMGVRTTFVPGLQSTFAFWWLDIDSELLFVGDAGTTEVSRPSRRYGVEFANYYNVTRWLTLDADIAWSQSRFQNDAPEGNYIPGSLEIVMAAGASVHDLGGFFGELRVRYFGPRSLIEDNSRRSDATTLLNGRVGYNFTKNLSAAIEVFNILDADASDIDYYYTSRLSTEAAVGVDDFHFHPAEPRSFRVMFTARF